MSSDEGKAKVRGVLGVVWQRVIGAAGGSGEDFSVRFGVCVACVEFLLMCGCIFPAFALKNKGSALRMGCGGGVMRFVSY